MNITIKENDETTYIEYTSPQAGDRAWTTGIYLVLLIFLPLIMIGAILTPGSVFWINLLLAFILSCVILFVLSFEEKKVEIHPERIYVKGGFFSKERDFPVKAHKMTVMIQNIPYMTGFLPKEKWRILLGYEDGIRFFLEETGDFSAIHTIAGLLSRKLNIPLIDYTYKDQYEIIMFFKPGEYDMTFDKRLFRYPDLLLQGEEIDANSVNENLITSRKKEFTWSPLSLRNALRVGFVALILAGGVFIKIFSTWGGLIYVPLPAGSDHVLYWLIVLGSLGYLTYLSCFREILTVTAQETTYQKYFTRFLITKISLPTPEITQIRIKPSPGGFVLMILSLNQVLTLKTYLGGILDFAQLHWMGTRLQDFILNSRERV